MSIPSNKDIELLSRKINEDTPDKGTSSQFAFLIRDENNRIITGCRGNVVYGSILLWVHVDYRKKGLGENLMNKVHGYGRKMYCKMATVITMDFQKARGFYDKLVYKCDFVRECYIDGATCMFL